MYQGQRLTIPRQFTLNFIAPSPAASRLPPTVIARILRHVLSFKELLDDVLRELHNLTTYFLFHHPELWDWPDVPEISRDPSVLRVCRAWRALGAPYLVDTFVFDFQRWRNQREADAVLRAFEGLIMSGGRELARCVRSVHVAIATVEQAESMERIFGMCGASIKELSWSFMPDEMDSEEKKNTCNLARLAPLTRGLNYLAPREVWTIDWGAVDNAAGPGIIQQWVERGLQRITVQIFGRGQDSRAWMGTLNVPHVIVHGVGVPNVHFILRIAQNHGVRRLEVYPDPDQVSFGEYGITPTDAVMQVYGASDSRVREVVQVVRPPDQAWLEENEG